MKEQNLAEEFRKIIDNMSDEELNQKLKELEPLNNLGPKVDDYLEFLEENKQKFKKGDFLKDEFGNIFICKEAHKTCWENEYLGVAFCVLFNNMMFAYKDWIWRSFLVSYATEEEKQKLLKVIGEKGYNWDTEKLELRKKEPEFNINKKLEALKSVRKDVFDGLIDYVDAVNDLFGAIINKQVLEYKIEEIREMLKQDKGNEMMKERILKLVSISGNGNDFEEIKNWLEQNV